MKIFQPVGQVRLTNVAVVKLLTHGFRFEVACYRNKILNYRAGIESDLDEVLQIHQVFVNVSRGQLANKEELVKVFRTSDIAEVCRKILEKGELQVSKEERQVTLAAIFRDICTIVSNRCINPLTGLPVTIGMVSTSLKELGFSVKLEQNTKKQALRAIDLLCTQLSEHICRASMRVRIVASVNQRKEIRQKLHELKCTIEEETPRGLTVFVPKATTPPTTLADGDHELSSTPGAKPPDFEMSLPAGAESKKRHDGRAGERKLAQQKVFDSKDVNASPTDHEVLNAPMERGPSRPKNRFASLRESVSDDESNDSTKEFESDAAECGHQKIESAENLSHSVSGTESRASSRDFEEGSAGSEPDENKSAGKLEADLSPASNVPSARQSCESEELAAASQAATDEGNSLSNNFPKITSASDSADANSEYTVMFLCDPNVYRSVERLATAEVTPPGRVIIVAANVKHVQPVLHDEPKRAATEQRDQDPSQVVTPTKSRMELEPPRASEKPSAGGIRCTQCNIWVVDAMALRKHSRTDWHNFNVKRFVKQLAPISEEEFNDLNVDIRGGFLAVD